MITDQFTLILFLSVFLVALIIYAWNLDNKRKPSGGYYKERGTYHPHYPPGYAPYFDYRIIVLFIRIGIFIAFLIWLSGFLSVRLLKDRNSTQSRFKPTSEEFQSPFPNSKDREVIDYKE